MPFLNNLPDLSLKGITASLNPMNFFTEQATPTSSQISHDATSADDTTDSTPRAEPGPGPSTNRTITRRNAPPPLETLGAGVGKGPSPIKSSLRPARPALDGHSQSSDSIDGLPGRRKSSGTNVVILDPEGDGTKRIRKGSMLNADGVVETRKRKKAALDTYIIVKPPPTASKNHLNLQVQLVVKTNRGRDRAASSSVFSARSPSMGSMIPSTQSSPAKGSIALPDSDNGSSNGTDLTTTRSESPARISDEQSPTTLGADLTRSTSLKSSVSGVSGISSKSTGTSLSAMTSGKRIEPMFNLAVHNVMQPTVVTDAATDTKVAKFLKRQVDIAGVGVLEPCEVWLPVPGANPLKLTNSSSDEGQSPPLGRTSRPLSMVSFNTPLTPTMSRTSEVNPKGKRGSMDIKNDLKALRDNLMNQNLASTPESAPKKFFGKLFKKKDSVDSSNKSIHRKSISEVIIEPASPNPDASSTTPNSTVRASVTEHMAFVGHSTFGTAPAVVHRRASDPIINPDGAVTGLTNPSAGPALQLAASRSSDGPAEGVPYPMIPSTRPIGYTWTMKKWAKKNSESWAAQLVAASAAGLDARMDNDVVFEWVKMKAPSAAISRITTRNTTASLHPDDRSKSRASHIDAAAESPLHSATSLALPRPIRTSSPFPPSPNLDGRPKGDRTISTRSTPTRPSTPTDEISTINTQTDDEAGYDSDPEDSETPWTCSVWIKKTNTRQYLGTLTPAPHHPKVIGILKIPVGLQAIPLCAVGNKPTPVGNEEKAKRQKDAEKRVREEVCITEEGLKDVICVSAMWLVAREEFGGLGRKKKV